MDKYIYEKENVISKEVCEEMIELFNSMPNKGYGTTAGGVRRNIKKTIDYNIPSKGEEKRNEIEINMWKDKRELLTKVLSKNIREYLIDIYDTYAGVLYDNIFTEGFMMQVYYKNDGSYRIHTDNAVKMDIDDMPVDRIVTFIFYMNDISEGGETELWKKIKIKPKAGKLLLFPACWTFPHSGNMPISDDKYIITGWFYKTNPLARGGGM